MLPVVDDLTVDDVARHLRVHRTTVQCWCRTGDLPATKIGRAYRIKKGGLDLWWAEHTQQSGEKKSHAQVDELG